MGSKTLNAKVLNVVKTTSQWAAEQSVIPKGMLCVEFAADDSVKVKIGDGVKTFSSLSYVNGADLKNHYTKSETDVKISEAVGAIGNVITIKGKANSLGSLPAAGNKAGDLWLIPSDNAGSDQYCEYMWIANGSGGSWELVGKTAPQIDLSNYATKTEVDSKISQHSASADEKYVGISDMVIINCTL